MVRMTQGGPSGPPPCQQPDNARPAKNGQDGHPNGKADAERDIEIREAERKAEHHAE
jgi:hypothetical protein